MSWKTISPEQFAELRGRRPDAELIDVRTPAEFERVHAAGARSVPLDRLDVAALLAGRGAEGPVYFICKSGARAGKACAAAVAAAGGGANVFNIAGGTDAWVAAGLPVVRGASRVIPLERQVRIAAGVLVFAGTLLGVLASPWFLVVPAFCGAGLAFAGITDTCGMGMLLARMPWNRGSGASQNCEGAAAGVSDA